VCVCVCVPFLLFNFLIALSFPPNLPYSYHILWFLLKLVHKIIYLNY